MKLKQHTGISQRQNLLVDQGAKLSYVEFRSRFRAHVGNRNNLRETVGHYILQPATDLFGDEAGVDDTTVQFNALTSACSRNLIVMRAYDDDGRVRCAGLRGKQCVRTVPVHVRKCYIVKSTDLFHRIPKTCMINFIKKSKKIEIS